jgi:citrate synthase
MQMQTETNPTIPAAAQAGEETQHDFDFPQREAAFFYGLFLRGHSAEELRRDIEVPQAVLLKWHREAEREPTLRDVFTRLVEYRRHVLAIFEALVDTESHSQRVQ